MRDNPLVETFEPSTCRMQSSTSNHRIATLVSEHEVNMKSSLDLSGVRTRDL